MVKEDKKLGFSAIKAEAVAVSANKAAQQFVNAATPSAVSPVAITAPEPSPELSKEKKLVVEGYLKDRGITCQKPIQLYLRNGYAEWMQQCVSSGRGGQQIMINYLIRRGIEAVERDYEQSGIIFASETTE